MRWAIAFASMLLCTSASAQDVPPRECEVEVREDKEWWSVGRTSARWTYWSENRARLVYSNLVFDEHYRHHFENDGPFSRWARGYFLASPRTMRAKGPMWANIAVEGKALPGKKLRVDDGLYTFASFPVRELTPYLDDATTMTINFYDRKAVVLDRIVVPMERVRAGANKLIPMLAEYDARISNPDHACHKQGDDVVLIQ